MSGNPHLQTRARDSHPGDRREAVLSSLIDLFLRGGFRSLSIEDMARWAHCSKRMIYTLGESKEQVILAVIRGFFRRAAEWIAEKLPRDPDPIRQIGNYLRLISEVLAPASHQFFVDLDAFPPAREIYQQNTRLAAEQVQQLVRQALGERSRVDPEFIGAVVGIVMNAIQRKEVEEATGLEDAKAYHALSALVVAGVRGSRA